MTQDNVHYTECRFAYASGDQAGKETVMEGAYFLLPKGYRGKVYFTLKGAIPTEYGTTGNDNAAVTFVF